MCKKSERKNSVTVSENAKSYEEEQILKYWTEERIRKASPLPFPMLNQPTLKRDRATSSENRKKGLSNENSRHPED